MVFDKTDTKLSSFINEAGVEDLSTIASQLFTRVGSLDQREQDQFVEQVQKIRRPSASSRKCRPTAGKTHWLLHKRRAPATTGALFHLESSSDVSPRDDGHERSGTMCGDALSDHGV